ncbi:DUF1559 family PulG-like putative transporter [Planctomicrobium piriforme]|uniref:Prepilin-type processing-associated H-X9-DG domain-containing protein n=1 Tax=Planctomicrobium piriforme TaxID=1576369 RepID=A0A1I3AWN0_9PLAN|nr:DUF1559 domain-containing protein [Planctomicrobium piriforme]SFH54505.1 prepilin-type processing-associated H-X9-DG domain-containing protein [Planctomicrobium piriforme]
MTESSDHIPETKLETPKRVHSWTWFFVEYGAIAFALLILLALLLPNVRFAKEPARRVQCLNNLRYISLAVLNYSEQYGSLPPAYTVDALGKPLHSWRTLILPFLDQEKLYKTIDLSKPWDDPANEVAFKTVVRAFQCPETELPAGQTTFVAMASDDLCFHPTRGRALSEFKDGTNQTVMVLETDREHAVHWMSPNDCDPKWFLNFDAKSPLAHPGGINVAHVDGSARFFRASTPAKTRAALMTIAGGDKVEEY